MTFRPALIRQTFTWAIAFTMTAFALTNVVSAQVIHSTGPRSKNTIKIDTNIKCEVKNDNDIDVKNKNDQKAKSGNANVQDNTEGGSAITGDAVNQNDTNLRVAVDNGTELPDVCNNHRNFAPCTSFCNTSARSFRSNAFRAADAFIPSAAAIAAPAVALTGVGGSGGGAPVDVPVPPEVAAAPFFAPEAADSFASSACSCSCGCGGYGGVGAAEAPFIGNTGPYSTNSIHSNFTDTTTIRNTNDISVNNTNQQTATSGTARVDNNTFGGDAASGSSFNGNSTDLGVSVVN